MLLLRLELLRVIARQPSNRTSNRASNTVLDALAQISHLALRFLSLALLVLSDALLLQALSADEAADCLFGCANILVPRASGAVCVVLCDTTCRCDRDGTGFGGCVGEIVFDVCGGFAVLALCLGQSVHEHVKSDGMYDRHTLSAVLPVKEPRAL